MSTLPIFSIIIPVYNRENIVVGTLQSILNQSFSSWECIVVDDGSADNTFEAVEKFCRNDKQFIILKRHESRKKGPNSCRNIGYYHSRGEWRLLYGDNTIIYNPLVLLEVISIPLTLKLLLLLLIK